MRKALTLSAKLKRCDFCVANLYIATFSNVHTIRLLFLDIRYMVYNFCILCDKEVIAYESK